MKNTLLFSALATMSVALVACPGPVATISSVTTPSSTVSATAGSQLSIPVTVTRASGNTTAPLTFTCQLSGGGLSSPMMGTATAPTTSGGQGTCVFASAPAAGTYTFTATSTQNTNAKATATVNVTAAATFTPQRIDAGKIAPATAPTGWTSDTMASFQCFVGAAATTGGTNALQANNSLTVNTSATNAAPAAVYQDERYCATLAAPDNRDSLRYTVTGVAGATNVRLHFAETYRGTSGAPAGARTFNVSVNGGTAVAVTPPVVSGTATAVVVNVPIPNASSLTATSTVTVSINGADPFVNGIEIL